MIDFKLLTTKDRTGLISNIGTDGFLLYCYLVGNQSLYESNYVSVKQIQRTFYNQIKDARSIVKYIDLLHKNNIITIKEDISGSTRIGIKSIIEYTIDKPKQFLTIPISLFLNEIEVIGSVGFAILTLFSKMHNNSFGGIGSGGFSNPSVDYIADVIGINRKTVFKYIGLLEKQKLLKVEKQGMIQYENEYGNITYRNESNHYFVQHIVNPNCKYYIERK